MKKKRDQSKPLPKMIPGGHPMIPSDSDREVMKKYGLKDRLRYDDIHTQEDDITPYRIWTIMNEEWAMYETFCDKVKKLDNLDDEIILKKLSESLLQNGWMAGYIAVVFDKMWHLIDGRHRFACAYAHGVDCFIKPRMFKKEFKHLKEHSIKVFHLLDPSVVSKLKLRYKIMSLLSKIKEKKTRKYLFSCPYKISDLGIFGYDCTKFINKNKNLFLGKSVIEIGSNVGFLGIKISEICKEYIGVEKDLNYLEISQSLKDFYKSNATFINNIPEQKYDVVISSENNELFQKLLNPEGIFIKCPLQH